MDDNRWKLLLLVVLFGLADTVLTQGSPPPVYRLPSSIVPLKYTIRLETRIDYGDFEGAILIEFNTTDDETQSLTSITLHLGTDVAVNEPTAVLIDTAGYSKVIGALIYDNDNTLLTVKLPDGDSLQHSHVYFISLNFRSSFNSEPKGIFSGYYNATSMYIASNFYPTHARDVFPCFDEPHFKVPISLQIKRPAAYYAISNAPLVSSYSIEGENMVLDTFSTTEPISIHTLGLFISQQIPVMSMGVNVIAPTGLTTSVPYLNTLLFNIRDRFGEFPIAPLNLVVLPDKVATVFSSYGFVFTSPDVYQGQIGSPLQWIQLKLTLTEEFLRQYLEHSKTPKWWSDIWLSESVGSYLALEFQEDEPLLNDWLKVVIRSEALRAFQSSAQPVITSEALSKWDIENMIANHTVKLKGFTILQMWNDTMPEGLVNKTLYDFHKLPLSVVSTSDLMDLMEANIRANTTYDVTSAIELLINWLTVPRPPVVWYSVDSTRKSFTLNQENSCSGSQEMLPIRPISISVNSYDSQAWSSFRQGNWLLNATNVYTLDSPLGHWTVLNIESASYQVHYGYEWNSVREVLESDWAPTSVRATLQYDAVVLSLCGCLDFVTSLSIINNTQRTNLDWFPVVKAAEDFTSRIGDDWYGSSAFGVFFAGLFSQKLLESLDLRNSSSFPSLKIVRELVTPWLCRFNISSCREAVVDLGGLLWQGGDVSNIDGSDIENVACYGAKYTPNAFHPLLAAYESASDPWYQHLYTVALSCLTEPSSVQQLLDSTLNDSSILHPNDVRQILVGLAASIENSGALTDFITRQSYEIQSKLGVHTLSTVIQNLAKFRVDLSKFTSLQNDSLDLNPFVVQSAVQAMAESNSTQSWWNDFSPNLLAVLPAEPTTTTLITTLITTPDTTTTTITTTAPITTTTPVTTSVTTTIATTAPTTASTSPKPPATTSTTTAVPPSGASSLSDYRVFMLVVTALMVLVDVTL